MLHQAFYAAQAGGRGEAAQPNGDRPRRRPAAADADGPSRTAEAARHLPAGEFVLRVAGQAGVIDALDGRVGFQETGQLFGRAALGQYAQAEGLDASLDQPAIEGKGMLPPSCWLLAMRPAHSPVSLSTTQPPSRSLWPPKYLVVECMTMSAPKSRGRVRMGVGQVLSTASLALPAWRCGPGR